MEEQQAAELANQARQRNAAKKARQKARKQVTTLCAAVLSIFLPIANGRPSPPTSACVVSAHVLSQIQDRFTADSKYEMTLR